MGNMSYCRFTNTLNDLRDCEEHFNDKTDEMSDEEIKAKEELIKTCVRIARNYGDEE